MLFRKKMKPSCGYCLYGAHLEGGEILCSRKGMRVASEKCWKFKYDPCKRIPHKMKPMDFSKYDKEDFSL